MKSLMALLLIFALSFNLFAQRDTFEFKSYDIYVGQEEGRLVETTRSITYLTQGAITIDYQSKKIHFANGAIQSFCCIEKDDWLTILTIKRNKKYLYIFEGIDVGYINYSTRSVSVYYWLNK